VSPAPCLVESFSPFFIDKATPVLMAFSSYTLW
jgi:hypothetical protein